MSFERSYFPSSLKIDMFTDKLSKSKEIMIRIHSCRKKEIFARDKKVQGVRKIFPDSKVQNIFELFLLIHIINETQLGYCTY